MFIDSPLHHLFYVSRAAPDLRKEEVDAIVARSTSFNLECEATGALVFSGDHFAQVLEAPRETLVELMRLIESDTRHHDIRMIFWQQLSARAFADWSMAYLLDLGKCDLLEELLVMKNLPSERIGTLIRTLFEARSLPM